MPRFRWEAVDAAGAARAGELDAPTANEAVAHLASQGLSVRRLGPATSARPTPAPQAAPAVRPAPRIPRAPGPAVRTRRSKPRDLRFLFSQLGQMLGAGIAPTDSLTHLTARDLPGYFQAALREGSRLTASGSSLADALACYPDLFPPSAVGAVRAGEAGGYLPDACRALEEQFATEHKMRRAVFLFRLVFVPGLFAMPAVLFLIAGMDRSFAEMSGLGGFFAGVVGAMAGSLGVTWLAGIGAYFLLAWWARGTGRRRLRHRLALALPVFGKRARAEGATTFAWHLGRLQRSGIPPYRAWGLAAAAVPNLALAEAVAAAGQGARESARVSELLAASGLLPPELVGVVQTGELTGQVADSLEQASQISSSDFTRTEAASRVSLYSLYFGLFVVLGIVGGVTFYTGYFNALYKHTVGEVEGGP